MFPRRQDILFPSLKRPFPVPAVYQDTERFVLMLIDFHTHAFPDFLAQRALDSLSKDIASAPLTDGTVAGLLSSMDAWGVDRAVICNIAARPGQTENVNAFAVETARAYPDRLFPLDPSRSNTRAQKPGTESILLFPPRVQQV